MKWNVVEIEKRLSELTSTRQSLIAHMRTTAEGLRHPVICPAKSLSDAIDDFRGRLDLTRTELGLSSESGGSSAGTLWGRLHDRAECCREAMAASRQLTVTERLTTPPGMEATLDPIRSLYQQVLERLESSPWSEGELVSEIREGHHPLQRIVSLVEQLYELTDDQWNTEMVFIQQCFGISVATAIARGRITLEQPDDLNA